jgi:hypothetical protein
MAPRAHTTISPSTVTCPQKLTSSASKGRRNWMKGEFSSACQGLLEIALKEGISKALEEAFF